MASSVPSFVMGFRGGTHRGQGALPVNLDSRGHASIPLGRVPRRASSTIAGLAALHGSAEHGSRRREKSRDKEPSPVAPGNYRFNTAGPQEAKDWSHALENVSDRVMALERNQRNQAESMSKYNAVQTQIGEQLGVLSSTLSQLKDRDRSIVDHMQQVQKNFDYVHSHFQKIETRIKGIENAAQSLIGNVSELASKLHGMQGEQLPNVPVTPQASSPIRAAAHQTPLLSAPSLSSPPRATMQETTSFPSPGAGAVGPAQAGEETRVDPDAVKFNETPVVRSLFPEMPRMRPMGKDNRPERPEHAENYAINSPGPLQDFGLTSNDRSAHLMRMGNRQVYNDQRSMPSPPGLYGGAPSMTRAQHFRGSHATYGYAHHEPYGMNSGPAYGNPHAPSNGWTGEAPSVDSWKAPQKKNDTLSEFHGEIEKYSMWSKRMVDHLCISHKGWRPLLKQIESFTAHANRAMLETWYIEGVNAWALSEELEGFLMLWLGEKLYNQRHQLSNRETGNGSEVWRQLFFKYRGGDAAVAMEGVSRLQEFQRCEKLDHLEDHLNNLESLLNEHAKELLHCPDLFRNLVLGLIPTDMEEFISTRPLEFPDYSSILAHARVQTVYRRTRVLAEHARKHAGRINAFTEVCDEHSKDKEGNRDSAPAPTTAAVPDVSEFIALVKKLDARMKKSDRNPRQSSSDKRKPAPKFKWRGGCFHCNDDNHQRKDCPEFKDIMKKHNSGKKESDWTLPPNYRGAFEKEREKWQKSNRGKINEFIGINSEDESDSDAEIPVNGRITSFTAVSNGTPMKQAVLAKDSVQTNPLTNRFHALQDDRINMLNDLNGWAHSVKVVNSGDQNVHSRGREISTKTISSSCKTSCDKKECGRVFHIQCEKDLEEFLKICPLAASNFGYRLNTEKAAARAAKKLADLHLEDDEKLILLDSGSSMDAANIEEDFPLYVSSVTQGSEQNGVGGATSACGGVITNKGKVTVNASVTDKNGKAIDFPIPFNNMTVQLPILSLRNTMKRGHTARLNDKGGYLRSLETGTKIPVYVKEGVYYLKVKILKPPCEPEVPPPPIPDPGLARPGR